MTDYPTRFVLDISNLTLEEQERLLKMQQEFDRHHALVMAAHAFLWPERQIICREMRDGKARKERRA